MAKSSGGQSKPHKTERRYKQNLLFSRCCGVKNVALVVMSKGLKTKEWFGVRAAGLVTQSFKPLGILRSTNHFSDGTQTCIRTYIHKYL